MSHLLDMCMNYPGFVKNVYVDEIQSALESVYPACTVNRSWNILNTSGPAATSWTKNLC